MADKGPKSAYELAMEKLRARDREKGIEETKVIGKAQKDRIAEIRTQARAKLAATAPEKGQTMTPSTRPHTNHLAKEKSPYLQQHAHNPVDWYPWGPEAFERARRENRPIFLSIGYSTCHWCHVMERESFENEEIAKVLNERFVCIKVDREERPDIDQIYMTAVTRLTGSGGWPLTVFLTPDLRP